MEAALTLHEDGTIGSNSKKNPCLGLSDSGCNLLVRFCEVFSPWFSEGWELGWGLERVQSGGLDAEFRSTR